tara:strand:+ start:3066 stop:3698 length:633 start_codon:yes stop_codon:yes gene_type:complete
MLELKNITYQPQTGNQAILQKLNLKIKENDIVVISGESGSGKTTLLEIISGLNTPQRGEILWKNKKLTSRHRRWLCGVVFQFPERFFIGTSIGKELKFGHKSINKEKIDIILEKVGLSSINLSAPPENLSGGQQRRLAVASQLLWKPSLILLDEPTAGLDWSMKNDVKNLIKRLKDENTFIIVTHEPNLFKELPCRFFSLNKGKINLIRG